eukprot:366067-Chlamydomonas_euryale.AAC.7
MSLLGSFPAPGELACGNWFWTGGQLSAEPTFTRLGAPGQRLTAAPRQQSAPPRPGWSPG